MDEQLNTLLIIDDDEMSLFLIRKMLERNQIAKTILPFLNGFDALGFLKKNANNRSNLPSLILLDVAMPEMDGWQFLKELNNIEFTASYKPSVCIVSAAAIVDFEVLKRYPVIKGYIVKPVATDKLMAVIESVMAVEKNSSVTA